MNSRKEIEKLVYLYSDLMNEPIVTTNDINFDFFIQLIKYRRVIGRPCMFTHVEDQDMELMKLWVILKLGLRAKTIPLDILFLKHECCCNK